ncbi:restriction modification system dna specificity domain-containing protein [Leptolyngbya sp. Heron Island J]|uniref:restriction endonuclease subunit S n=1 Tax=Leptolyngbya sp. Heron Island J TaxID=1385935 RepID=UPI0003B981DB|nr:restriction modification system DNA specificity domain-containing protein [Leptolyngbya sp. Heron Island J]ESA35120.1 restriction modification system dna specificity domain-containing protein [Leptolyngbya sp. Heron Island J]
MSENKEDLPELPKSWSWICLDDVLLGIEAGKSFKAEGRPPSDNEVGVLKVSAVTWKIFNDTESKTCLVPEQIEPRFFVQPGDFLFSRANTIDLVGACVIVHKVSRRVMLSDKTLRFRFSDISPDWVLYMLRTGHGRNEIERLATGNQDSMRNIGQARIRRIRIPCPPLAEQYRIVNKIEELFTQLDAGVDLLKKLKVKLKRYRQAVLKAAVEGKLTQDWRAAHQDELEPASVLLDHILKERREKWEADQLAKMEAKGKVPKNDKWKLKYKEPPAPDTKALPELPEHWTWTSMDCLGSISGGVTKNSKRKQFPLQMPYLRVANVYSGELRLQEMKEIGVAETEIDRVLLQAGDLLIVEGNGSIDQIGRVAIWDGSIEPCLHQNHLIKIRFSPTEIGQYALRWMLSINGRKRVI